MCVSSVVTIVLMLHGKRTCPDGALHVSSANGLVGTGFASRYRLQHFMATGHMCRQRYSNKFQMLYHKLGAPRPLP